MAGMIVKVAGRETLTFNVQSGGSGTEVVLAKGIDVSTVREATLIVRVHSGTNLAGGTAAVKVRAESPSPDDPAVDFIYPAPLSPPTTSGTDTLGKAEIDGVTAPGLVLASIGFDIANLTHPNSITNFGTLLRVSLVVVPASSGGALTMTVVLSVELALKV